jgi:hypothetical protein
VIEVLGAEGFLVSAPYWTFENLVVRGACEVDSRVRTRVPHSRRRDAFHRAQQQARRLQCPLQGERRAPPLPRPRTDRKQHDPKYKPSSDRRPGHPIDIVAASHWTVRGNLISDFVKARADRISYGAFAKGGGSGNRFERNVVLCEDALRGQPGWRVGISLGGGGSVGGGDSCRDRTCVLEQSEGTIEANLVASCSDDGIYINRSA